MSYDTLLDIIHVLRNHEPLAENRIISQANEKTRPLLTGRGLLFVKVKQRVYNDAHSQNSHCEQGFFVETGRCRDL